MFSQKNKYFYEGVTKNYIDSIRQKKLNLKIGERVVVTLEGLDEYTRMRVLDLLSCNEHLDVTLQNSLIFFGEDKKGVKVASSKPSGQMGDFVVVSPDSIARKEVINVEDPDDIDVTIVDDSGKHDANINAPEELVINDTHEDSPDLVDKTIANDELKRAAHVERELALSKNPAEVIVGEDPPEEAHHRDIEPSKVGAELIIPDTEPASDADISDCKSPSAANPGFKNKMNRILDIIKNQNI